jgi:hypothetical protein
MNGITSDKATYEDLFDWSSIGDLSPIENGDLEDEA